MSKFFIMLFILVIFSCNNQDKNQDCNFYKNSYKIHYSELNRIGKQNPKYKSEYDSTLFYIDRLLISCNPNSITLLSKKLTILSLNEDFAKMIPIYDKLIVNDSINKDLIGDYEYARFYSMVMADSVRHKGFIYDYYRKVKQENLSDLLENPNIYNDQSEIYKRMTLSYYFEGRDKTLEDFKKISNVIPYKFKYDIILNNRKSKIEFLRDSMK